MAFAQIPPTILTDAFVAVIAVLIVALLIWAVWLLLDWRGVKWQRRSEERLGQIEARLKHIETIGERITTGVQEFPAGDPDPYGPIAAELHQMLGRVAPALEQLTRTLGAVRQEEFPAPAGRLHRIGQGFWSKPRFQRRQLGRARALGASADELQAQVDQCAALLERLQAMPWKVALEARDLLDQISAAQGMLAGLQTRGLHGAEVDLVALGLQQAASGLANLPPYFLAGTRDQVLQEGKKHDTVCAWEAHADLEARTQPHFDRLLHWQAAYEELGKHLDASAASLRQIAADMAELSGLPRYPVSWSESQAKVGTLRQLQASIGDSVAKRTPDGLDRDVDKAKQLAKGTAALANDLVDKRAGRDKLALFLARPDVSTVRPWLDQARALATAALRHYDLGNWALGDAIERIEHDAGRLADRHKALTAPYLDGRLPESALSEGALSEIDKFVSDLDRFQGRLQRAGDVLKTVQDQERKAHHVIKSHHEALDALMAQFERAEGAPSRPGVANARRTLEKVRAEGEELEKQLKSYKGQMRKKAGRVNQWAEDCPEAMQAVVQALEEEIGRVKSDLEGEIQALQELAPFHEERAMAEAQKMARLKYGPDYPATGKPGQSSFQPFAVRAGDLLEMLDRLQRSLDNVRDRIETPLNREREALEKWRHDAGRKLEYLDSIAAEAGPDAAGRIARIRSGFEGAERDLAGLKRNGGTLDRVLRQVEALAGRFEEVADEADELAKEI